MNDSLTVNAILPAGITGGSVVDATARVFPRIASRSTSDSMRQSLHVGSTSPTTIRVAHQPVKGTNETRSVFGLGQTLARVDGQGNVIATDKILINETAQMDKTRVSLVEFRTAYYLRIGAMLANNGANIDAMYNGEV